MSDFQQTANVGPQKSARKCLISSRPQMSRPQKSGPQMSAPQMWGNRRIARSSASTHFGNRVGVYLLQGCLCHCPMPSSSATAQPIPSFFVDFLHRFHQMVSEYSAELSRWSGGMRFCPQQQTLYGRKFAAAPPPATKVRRSLRTEEGKGSPTRPDRTFRNLKEMICIEIKGHISDRLRRTLAPEHLANAANVQMPLEMLEQTVVETLPESITERPYFVSDGTQQNASPDTEQRRPSRRRAAAVQPPLSISDRLRRTLAPEHLANAANVQMPLEMLEQTVVETLPESITESGNYADLLCQYLDGFEHELGNELDIGCWLCVLRRRISVWLPLPNT
uniref:Uncharacterized protein n=1 Tax=Globodera pallida TaxID=36090 RepID=A0A183CPB5_GLOPA